MSVQVPCPIWAKSLVCPRYLSDLGLDPVAQVAQGCPHSWKHNKNQWFFNGFKSCQGRPNRAPELSGRPPGRPLGVPWVSLGVPGGSLSGSEASLEVAGGSLGGLMGALGLSWWVLGELWGPIWASLAALETIEKPLVFVVFPALGAYFQPTSLARTGFGRLDPLSVQVPCPIWTQVTCLSKSLVQFGPSHLSVQGICPIWAKSLSPKLPKDTPVAGNATKTNGFSMVSEAARDAQIGPQSCPKTPQERPRAPMRPPKDPAATSRDASDPPNDPLGTPRDTQGPPQGPPSDPQGPP